MNRKVILAVVMVVVAVTILALAGVAGASSKAKLAGSVPAWAKAANLKATTSNTQQLGFRVYLNWRNVAGAEALAKAVSDPASASYGHYLTPEQFRQRFSPTAADLKAVRGWLTDQGFSIVYTPANGHYVSAEGTVAEAEAAFGAQLNEYKVDGKVLRAPATALTVPASLAGVVAGVVGVDESGSLVHPYIVKDAPPSPGFRNAPPLSDYWAEFVSPYAYPAGFTDVSSPAKAPWTVTGYTPAQIKGAYGISGAYDGSRADRRRHRRLRVAHDPGRREPVVAQPRPAEDEAVTTGPGRGARHVPPPAEPGAGPAGLVRRGDAGHRGRARHGAGREDRVRRLPQQLPGHGRGDEPRRGPAPGEHRDQLLRLGRRSAAQGLHQALRGDARPGRRRGHRRVLLVRRRRR